jgi:hypothetical protein
VKKKHAAQDELEKAEGALRVAQERLDVVTQMLPKKEAELEDLIVTNELKGYKKPAITRTQNEIVKLKAEKEILDKTICALRKKLPELEKAARIETAATETTAAYKEAYEDFKGMLEGPPASEGIIAGIEALEQYCRDIYDRQDRYRRIARQLNELMISEGIPRIGEISQEQLFGDRSDVSPRKLQVQAEAFSPLAQRLVNVQNSLLLLEANQLPAHNLVRPPEPVIEPEYSPDGKYKIAFEQGYWRTYQKVMKPADNSFMLKPTWVKIGYSDNKPSWPQDKPKRKSEPQKKPAMSHAVDIAHVGRKVDPDKGK